MEILKKYKKELIVFLVGLALIISFTYRFEIKYFFLEVYRKKSNNKKNEEILKSLHPIFRVKVSKFVHELEKRGSEVTLTSGYRSPEKQAQLFSEGKTTAPALSSYHNYGMAVDLNIDGLKMASSKSKWLNNGVVSIGKEYGFRWGGDFSSFYDPIHFDLGNEYSIDSLRNKYKSGNLTASKFLKL